MLPTSPPGCFTNSKRVRPKRIARKKPPKRRRVPPIATAIEQACATEDPFASSRASARIASMLKLVSVFTMLGILFVLAPAIQGQGPDASAFIAEAQVGYRVVPN